MRLPAVITIGIDPNVELGPITLTWHGLTIALGILIGGLVAARWARVRGLPTDPLYTIGLLLTLGGVAGGRVFYLLERDPAGLLDPGTLLGTRGFTFFGGVILAGLLIVVYLRRTGLSVRYLDAVAFGLPLGVAIGRIGDVINGEHYGPRSDFFLAVRNSHPDALTPDPTVAFHNGGLYDLLLGAAVFALVWALRHRVRRPGAQAWLVLALFSVGRFFEFFYRSDSDDIALGLNSAQWTSVGLLAVAAIGWAFSRRRASSWSGGLPPTRVPSLREKPTASRPPTTRRRTPGGSGI